MTRDWIYEQILRPLLFNLDSEDAHNFTQRIAKLLSPALPLVSGAYTYQDTDLACDLFETRLKNPIGLAAGFDKNGKLVSILGQVGFGFAEIGSVCAKPCAGNPKPRLFRLPADQALINRLGLNGEGVEAIFHRLSQSKLSLPIGINIAKTNDPQIKGDGAIEDILTTFKTVQALPLVYIAINASCPNTKEGIVDEVKFLDTLFAEAQKLNAKNLPVLVKLSPDSTDSFVEEVVRIASGHNLKGFICGNTSTRRDILLTPAKTVENIGMGGLSGAPLKALNLILCRKVAKLKDAEQIVIACGGINSGQDVYDYKLAGASFFQLYTGLVYHGPQLVKQINQELSELLRAKSALS